MIYQTYSYIDLEFRRNAYRTSHDFSDHIVIPDGKRPGTMQDIILIDEMLNNGTNKIIIQRYSEQMYFIAFTNLDHTSKKYKYVGHNAMIIERLLNLSRTRIYNDVHTNTMYIEDLDINKKEILADHLFDIVVRDTNPSSFYNDQQITFTRYFSSGLLPTLFPYATNLFVKGQQYVDYTMVTTGLYMSPPNRVHPAIEYFEFRLSLQICEIPIILPHEWKQKIHILDNKSSVMVKKVLTSAIPNSYQDLKKSGYSLLEYCYSLPVYDDRVFKDYSMVLDDYVFNYNDDAQLTAKIIECLDLRSVAHAHFLIQVLMMNPFAMNKQRLQYNAKVLDELSALNIILKSDPDYLLKMRIVEKAKSNVVTKFDPFYRVKVKILNLLAHLF